MKIEKIAAFSEDGRGGNPTGVLLLDEEIQSDEMQYLASNLGYTETAFASRQDDGRWFARYFSPEVELPSCGHGTTTLGAVLAEKYGTARYEICHKDIQYCVDGQKNSNGLAATTHSPNTHSKQLNAMATSELLDVFGYRRDQLDPDIPPAIIYAGSTHFVLALKNREDLANMFYEMEEGCQFMRDKNIFSIMLVFAENNHIFHARNTYAAWGAMEDPATASAAAALSGYLRDIGWPHENALKIIQGEDMGAKSILRTEFSDVKGSPVKVIGRMNKLDR
ncbi:PhzF family phenazine biosynthesis isomerase [Lentilitoribacter sp. Alg239-R112]|uniref:PhzF family phenazine biosynthesis protein n=1 Tax=Lentilitoribacter sp. Alg239-R112 TaxID=2305987 RepID=UPI0013A6CF65|nr:PhzF family phenazine biosynthesis isomerase [Lentilitoribacter sp. Alg239-R112]